MKKIPAVALGLAAAAALAPPALAHEHHSTVTVVAGQPSEYSFTLSAKAVAHGSVSFVVWNKGTVRHNFQIDGKTTPVIPPGESATLTVELKKRGSYTYDSTLSGQAAAGMRGVLQVT